MNKKINILYMAISFTMTMALFFYTWGNISIFEFVNRHGSDMLTFYQSSRRIDHIYEAFYLLPSKTVFLSVFIRFSELFIDYQSLVFVILKWSIYIFSVTYLLNVLHKYELPPLFSSLAPFFLYMHLPTIVYIPQVLRDDLIASVCFILVACRLDLPFLSGAGFYRVFGILIISLLSLFYLRPEYAMLLLLIFFYDKPKKLLIFILPILVFFFIAFKDHFAGINTLINTFIHVLNFWQLEFGVSLLNGIRMMLFSPAPMNVPDVISSGFAHKYAGLWFFITVPLGLFLTLFYVVNLPNLARSIFRKNVPCLYLFLFPMVILIASSLVNSNVQGPRQGLVPSVLLGIYGVFLIQRGIHIVFKSNYIFTRWEAFKERVNMKLNLL